MRTRDALSSDEAFRDALLSAGRSERPDPRARRAAIGAVIAGTSTVAATSVSAGAKLTSATPFASLIAKVAVVSALAIAPFTPEAPTPEAPAPRDVAAAPPSLTTFETPRPAERVIPDEPPRRDAEPAAPAQTAARPTAARPSPRIPTPKATPASIDPPDALLQEVERLEATRRALDAGDLPHAARLLQKPAGPGALDLEATVLSIELLVRQGRDEEARAAAARFVAAHPASPLTARVAHLLAAAR